MPSLSLTPFKLSVDLVDEAPTAIVAAMNLPTAYLAVSLSDADLTTDTNTYANADPKADSKAYSLFRLFTCPAAPGSIFEPFPSSLVAHRYLSGPKALKRILEISLSFNNIEWSPSAGDVIGIMCPNPDRVVIPLLARLALPHNAVLDIALLNPEKSVGGLPFTTDVPCTIYEAFKYFLDLDPPLRKPLLRIMAEYATNDTEKATLMFLTSPKGTALLKTLKQASPSFADLLATFSSVRDIPLARIFESLTRLQSRFYSISKIDNAVKTISVAFNIIEYKNSVTNQRIVGLCSGFLESLTLTGDNKAEMIVPPVVPIFLKKNTTFRPPADASVPIILIAAGTGITPFLSFLQAREQQQDRGKAILFHGRRFADIEGGDRIYGAEIDGYLSTGTLTRFVEVASREQLVEGVKYVQDAVLRDGAAVWEMLSGTKNEAAACVYVCGGVEMARDVHATFAKILKEFGGMSDVEVKIYLKELVSNGRAINDEYQEILSGSSSKNWAIFGYDKMSNDLRVLGSGDDGLEELAEEWDDSKILYAFAKVVEPISKLPKFVFISWCGDGVPIAKKGLFHHHVNDAVKFFKGFHVHINARAELDVTPEAIMKKVKDSSGAKYSIHNEGSAAPSNFGAATGSTYVPVQTNPKPFTTSYGTATSSYKPPVTVSSPAVAVQFSRPSLASSTTPSFQRPTVAAVPAAAPPALSVSVSTTRGISATAVFTYEAGESNEISFTEGDLIVEIEKVDEGWWQGRHNVTGKVGLFPKNYVEEIVAAFSQPSPPPIATPAAPPLFNRPSFGVSTVQAPYFSSSSAASPKSPPNTAAPYLSSSANKWLGDDDDSQGLKKSGYVSSFVASSTVGEDKVAAAKERREREDKETREREEAETRAREERERRGAAAKEERQRAAAFAAASTFSAAPVTVSAGGISATAVYQYDAQEDNEIGFAEGELITDIEKTDEGWWQGKNSRGQIGLFPAAYVEEIKVSAASSVFSPAASAGTATPARPQAVESIEALALYDYEAAEPNEITFATGDRITNIVYVSEDWWQGRINGVEGLFPGTYVEVQK
ncbi:hypothetical protein HK100_012084 [Physocladia obscura]|uniref:Uncharacterized protein n=1 Tax=Physocladia obscura TaxID=109957 RepID=A0AAD5XDK2_9FUNG|nr:hypothetical protein HK100_012084 [Physocladia obscura]